MLIATRRRRGLARFGAALAIASFLTTVLVGAPANAASITGPLANGSYLLNNANSGLCLAYDPSARGAARQEGCNDDNTTTWYVANAGGDNYVIINEHNNQCLSIWGGGVNDGDAAFVYDCQGTTDQMYTLIPATLPIYAGSYQLRNVHSGKCVAVGGGRTNKGAWVIQWGCAENGAYMWRAYNF
ncbi:RICIN domain-containing protein [Actinokineospora enzanensis]|uniref:RICIN domain-containing protein n=1 Tax=Actinokineospora enzanensis TaxID=155975 RepID=UPI00036E67FE|nr:RICIN domain-containing protein [Actinokineospora enzanensis]